MITTLQRILAALLILITAPGLCMSPETEVQQKIKLIRFIINKTSWPAGSIPTNRFTICLLGEQEENAELQKLSGQRIQNRIIEMKTFTPNEKTSSSCQMIYLMKIDPEEQKQLIKQYTQRPVLLLADSDPFARTGGAMNFVMLHNAIALTVNLESMARSKLKFDLKELDQVIVVPEESELK